MKWSSAWKGLSLSLCFCWWWELVASLTMELEVLTTIPKELHGPQVFYFSSNFFHFSFASFYFCFCIVLFYVPFTSSFLSLFVVIFSNVFLMFLCFRNKYFKKILWNFPNLFVFFHKFFSLVLLLMPYYLLPPFSLESLLLPSLSSSWFSINILCVVWCC